MTLKNKYNEVLLNQLLLKQLKLGIVPNIDELTTELEALQTEKPMLGSVPLVALEDTAVAFYESAQAQHWNHLHKAFKDDLTAFNEYIQEQFLLLNTQLTRWDSFYRSSKFNLAELEDNIDNLLLIHLDTLGYFKFVSDDFLSLELVDTINTTAKVDTNSGLVTIGTVTTESAFIRLDLSSITPVVAVVSANILQSSTTTNGAVNALLDSNSYWSQRVITQGISPVTMSYLIPLNELTYVNKISFQPWGSSSTASFNVSCYYSTDGVNFLLLPGTPSTISIINEELSFSFVRTNCKYIKILITKNGPDLVTANGNEYIFGAKSIRLYDIGYNNDYGTTLYSTERTLENLTGDNYTFTKCALSVCENILSNTDISYYVSLDNEAWLPIAPLERISSGIPQVIDFGNSSVLTNADNGVFDSTRTSTQLDIDNVSVVTLTNINEVPLNSLISTNVSDMVPQSLVVWRNVGNQSLSLVRNYSNGWSYKDNRYETIIRVEDPNGYQIDLGLTTALLDGLTITGVVTISPGTHIFSTSIGNWLSLPLSISSHSDFLESDTLYPFNHKYLIEGYPYPVNYSGTQTYIGVDLYAEKRINYVDLVDFISFTDNDLDVYTRTTNGSGDLVFVVKFNNTFSDYSNEEFLIEYKVFERSFSSVRLKALFTTDGVNSPSLDSYTIKLG